MAARRGGNQEGEQGGERMEERGRKGRGCAPIGVFNSHSPLGTIYVPIIISDDKKSGRQLNGIEIQIVNNAVSPALGTRELIC